MIRKFTQEEKIEFFKNNSHKWKVIGNVIKNVRLELKISRKTLAKMAGISVGTLKKLEYGRYIRRFKVVSKSCLNALEGVINKNNLVWIKNMEIWKYSKEINIY